MPELRLAVPCTPEDAEEGCPRSDFFAELMGEDPRELVQMREVVRAPSGQQVAERDDAEARVTTTTFEIFGREIERAETVEIVRAGGGEGVEEFGKGSTNALAVLRFAVERDKRLGLAVFKDHVNAGHPVGMLAMK